MTDTTSSPSPPRRRWLTRPAVAIVLIVAAIGAGTAVATVANSNDGNHSVVLVNEQDARALQRAGFSLQRELGDTVDNRNAAAAVSSGCEGCRTVAVALQVVLVESDPSTVVPENLALALNQQCTGCESMAAAYQYVLTTDGIVRFTPEGQQQMSAIEHEISDIAGSSLPFPELEAALDVQVARYWDVVESELVRVGIGHTGTPKKKIDVATEPEACPGEACPPSTASPAPTEPDASASPSGSPGEAAEGCPSHTPSPSASAVDPSASPSPEPCASPTAAASPTPTGDPPDPSVSPSP